METVDCFCTISFKLSSHKEGIPLTSDLSIKCLEKELSGNTEHLLEILAQTSYNVKVVPVAVKA